MTLDPETRNARLRQAADWVRNDGITAPDGRPQQGRTQMTRAEATQVAIARFHEMNRALFAFWSGKGPEVDEASFGYRHGWFNIEGHSIGAV